MTNTELRLSALPKTWIIDVDGTLVKHNGHIQDGCDSVLSHTKEFVESISPEDMVIIVTSRAEEYRDQTIQMLDKIGVHYNHIIFGAPMGERIIINDDKPSGLKMAHAINLARDEGIVTKIVIDPSL